MLQKLFSGKNAKTTKDILNKRLNSMWSWFKKSLFSLLSIIWDWFKQVLSYLGSTLIVVFATVIMTGFVYIFATGDAHIAVSQATIRDIENIQAQNVSCDLTGNMITVKFKNEDNEILGYLCEGFIIDGQTYSIDEWDLIIPANADVWFELRSENEDGRIYINRIPNYGFDFQDNNTSVSMQSEPSLSVISVEFNNSIRIVAEGNLVLTIVNNVRLANRTTGNFFEHFNGCTIIADQRSGIDLTIEHQPKLNIRRSPSITNYSTDISINGISTLKAKITGSLSFRYSTTPSEFGLLEHLLFLSNRNGEINAHVNLTNDSAVISMNGLATNATISNFNLFPSFERVFRDSAYTLPTTLITIIGGLALSISNSRKRKDNKTTSETPPPTSSLPPTIYLLNSERTKLKRSRKNRRGKRKMDNSADYRR